MDAWWWVPVALTAWFAVAVAAGLWLGPVLRRWSQARKVLEPHTVRTGARAHIPWLMIMAAGRRPGVLACAARLWMICTRCQRPALPGVPLWQCGVHGWDRRGVWRPCVT